MAARQPLLLAPDRPLVTRLGRRFFRSIPRQAGVYKMHDATGAVVYVGKAVNLRQRLASYRVANPERLAARQLRLLQTVTRIEFELCRGESAALKHEAKLIRRLRPKFNRAGVWPGRPRFIAWRGVAGHFDLELAVPETPLPGWDRFGPLGAAVPLRAAIARLLWHALQGVADPPGLPLGWMHNRLPATVRLSCAGRRAEIQSALVRAFSDGSPDSLEWFNQQATHARPGFELAWITRDLQFIQSGLKRTEPRKESAAQMMLL